MRRRLRRGEEEWAVLDLLVRSPAPLVPQSIQFALFNLGVTANRRNGRGSVRSIIRWLQGQLYIRHTYGGWMPTDHGRAEHARADLEAANER